MGGNKIEVRIPILEISGQQFGGELGQSERPLTIREKEIALSIFESSIKLNEVRIVRPKKEVVSITGREV